MTAEYFIVQNPWFWEIPRLILRLDWIGVSRNDLKLFIKSNTIIWQKQHFLVKNSPGHEKLGLFQLFINFFGIVKSKSNRAVPRYASHLLVLKWYLFRSLCNFCEYRYLTLKYRTILTRSSIIQSMFSAFLWDTI